MVLRKGGRKGLALKVRFWHTVVSREINLFVQSKKNINHASK